jgi:hypothetical protein
VCIYSKDNKEHFFFYPGVENVKADSPGQEGAARRQGVWKAYAGLLETLGLGWIKNRGELADLKSDSSEA